MSKARRRIRLASLAVALTVGALAAILIGSQFASPAGAQAPGAMAVDCDAGTPFDETAAVPDLGQIADLTPGVQTDCNVSTGGTFAIAIHNTPPSGGYDNFQVKIRWSDAALNYMPYADAANEAIWPQCDIPARTYEEPGIPPNNPADMGAILYGCAQFAFPPETEMDTEAVLKFRFQCATDVPATIELIARAGDVQQGSHFLDPAGNTVDGALSSATVNCGVEPVPTPTAPTGGETPEPTADTGAGTAVPTALPGTGFGEQDGGQGGNLWLLVGALAVAAGGLTFFGWRYAQSRR
jgi:hypothetical protein